MTVAAPRREPRAAPMSSTANVCAVTGTGLKGSGTAMRAASAMSALPATTAPTMAGQVGATRRQTRVCVPITGAMLSHRHDVVLLARALDALCLEERERVHQRRARLARLDGRLRERPRQSVRRPAEALVELG